MVVLDLRSFSREGTYTFRNAFGWSIGAAYSVTAPLAVFAFLEGSTPISPDQSF